MENKQCKNCNKYLPLDRFEIKHNKVNGKEYIYTRGTCRKCMNDKYDKSWRERNKDKSIEYNRKWQSKNPEKMKKSSKKYNDKIIKELSPVYLKNLIKSAGKRFDKEVSITPKLLELKKTSLQYKRDFQKHLKRYNLK